MILGPGDDATVLRPSGAIVITTSVLIENIWTAIDFVNGSENLQQSLHIPPVFTKRDDAQRGRTQRVRPLAWLTGQSSISAWPPWTGSPCLTRMAETVPADGAVISVSIFMASKTSNT